MGGTESCIDFEQLILVATARCDLAMKRWFCARDGALRIAVQRETRSP